MYWLYGHQSSQTILKAKDKEQAVLHLYRIYGLAPVNHGGFALNTAA